jgi:uncharacterized protein involved in exopolysaccharide biosynthesis
MNQKPQSATPYPVNRGDELDLIELWKVLFEYKLLIIVFTVITTLGAIYYASTLPTIYKVEVLMIPANGVSGGVNMSNSFSGLAGMAGISIGGNNTSAEGEEAIARLKTRSFLINHIKEKNLKPILFAHKWNEAEEKWIGQEPSNSEAFELLKGMVEIGFHPKSKASLASLTVEWKNSVNPNKIADIANGLVSNMNFKAKQRAILEAKNSISFLEEEIGQTSILNAQTILYNLIEQQTSKIMMANVRDEFVFKVIDPAVVPRREETKPVLIIIFIGMVLGIFSGSFLSISVNYFKEQLQKQ